MSLGVIENNSTTCQEPSTRRSENLAEATIRRSSRAFDSVLLREGREPSINDGILTKVYASYSANCCSHPTCEKCSSCK